MRLIVWYDCIAVSGGYMQCMASADGLQCGDRVCHNMEEIGLREAEWE